MASNKIEHQPISLNRYLVILSFPLILIIIVGGLVVSDMYKSITFIRSEIIDLNKVSVTNSVVRRIENIAFLKIGKKSVSSKERKIDEAKINEDIESISALTKIIQSDIKIKGLLAEVNDVIKKGDDASDEKLSASKLYNKYYMMLDKILYTSEIVNEESALILDPERRAYHLGQLISSDLVRITVLAGKLRSLLLMAAEKPEQTISLKDDASKVISTLYDLTEKINRKTDFIIAGRDDVEQDVIDLKNKWGQVMAEFLKVSAANVKNQVYQNKSVKAFEVNNELYEKLRASLMARLNLRLAGFVQQLYISVALLLFGVVFMVLLSFNVYVKNQRTYNLIYDMLQMYQNHLEELVNERTSDLKRINTDMESFTYMLAHDMSTPIRTVVSYSQIIKSSAQEKLNKDEIKMFDRVVSAGKKMSDTVTCVLDLAKINHIKINKESVKLTELLNDHILNKDKFPDITFIIDEEMTAFTDRELLTTVMRNLLDNAINFSKPTKEPSIEVGVSNISDVATYFVADNGIGLDMTYSQSVFNPFNKLNQIETTGLGTGLTMARKIIQRLGGEIWIRSEPGAGTTVFFTLPK
ncbi:MAG: ATP-binding protein [Gammaproteobacteria bacterium]|nr:ATP-binding protein [Gammaproteobacteria bacterium]